MRKLIRSFATGAAIISITACGGEDTTPPPASGASAVVVAPTPTPTPSPTPTAAVVADGGYVLAKTLDGADPLHADFDVARGLTATGIPGNYSDVKGAFRFVCGGKGKLAYDDPVVFPGQPGKSHLHQSWGNADFSAATTPASLQASAVTDCNNTPYSLNRSLYWMPALLNDQAEAVQPDLVVVYYKQWSSDSGPCIPGATNFVGKCLGIPNQIRFVFGWNMMDPTAPVKGASWTCGGETAHNLEDLFATGKCTVGTVLTADTLGPNCWDGKYLDTPDHRSHTAYADYDTKGRYFCPATHPYAIPQEENKAQWTVTADMLAIGSGGTPRPRIYLASDAMLPGAKAGETLHADYMEGWVWEAKKMWYDNCIEKRLSCSSGVLGNGYKMLGAEQPTYGWINPSPRVKLSSI